MIKSRPLAGRAAAPWSSSPAGCPAAASPGPASTPALRRRSATRRSRVSQVDSVASNYCSAIDQQLQPTTRSLPLHYLRGGIAGRLTLVAAAQQLAATTACERGTQYDQKVAELQGAVAALPEDQQDAVIAIESSAAYIGGVEQAVGEKVLAAQGTTAASSRPGRRASRRSRVVRPTRRHDRPAVRDGDQGRADRPDRHEHLLRGRDTAKNGDAASPTRRTPACLPASHRCG